MDAERERLRAADEDREPWRLWGPYLSERQWATVREDYSEGGTAWEYFPHDHARSRAYRWGEDGLLGISDDESWLCFGLALWNGVDPILKERLFGLTGNQGNHGEDVKEYYYYLDSTPTHSYMKGLYKYPQRPFPYQQLIDENANRGKLEPEFELIDTGIFDDDRYFDVFVEYAKAGPSDVLVRITVENRGPEAARLHVLPQLWFRNTWSWGIDNRKPALRADKSEGVIEATHHGLGTYWLACEGGPPLLFTDNETNAERLWDEPNASPHVKDAFHEAVVDGRADALNAEQTGTKAAAHYRLEVQPGKAETIVLRLSSERHAQPFADASLIFRERIVEADAFYAQLARPGANDDERLVQRQAFAGLLWSKQYYEFDVDRWLDGDPAGPAPPAARRDGRNAGWRHLNTSQVLLMPDKWEYPWFAAWDLAFHCVPMSVLDAEFAKKQLLDLMREWYMHPNGQIPAYEWAFGDVNPPVFAVAARRVFQLEREFTGNADYAFLEKAFHKLMLNFTWWVNRKDSEGNNVFGGGFLGLDNISVFDRSQELPGGGHLEQSDGTAWMGQFCVSMLAIALDLAAENPVYEDIATKFFEHFMYICGALNDIGGTGSALWDEDDGFFYDLIHFPDGSTERLKVRSLVGLIPLLAVAVVNVPQMQKLPEFRKHVEWFIEHKPELASLISRWHEGGMGDRRMLALVHGDRMRSLLARMLDPDEFLSDYGIRALSRVHLEHPYAVDVDGTRHEVRYEPAESSTGLFGGNSNWRGPIWFPVNFLIVRALERYYTYYGDGFKVEHPTGSGQMRSLLEVAQDLQQRLINIFLRDERGRRPVFGGAEKFQTDPNFRDHVLFYEYFHGDNGAGIGASHQTGWTALVAQLMAPIKTT